MLKHFFFAENNLFLFFAGGLGSYTPSKMSRDNPFQLGVSRTVPHASLSSVITLKYYLRIKNV